ncbi:hypothetical protein NL676_020434 [Syzygium grande]|nr:hypothetical protein NL676_020434 [Syzygium grande]
MPCLQSLLIRRCRHLEWQSLLVVIRGLTLLKSLRFAEMPEEFALAFYPYSSSRMREGILQEYYEEVMERNLEVSFVWVTEDDYDWHDLGRDSYNAIKRRVMSRVEVLPEEKDGLAFTQMEA